MWQPWVQTSTVDMVPLLRCALSNEGPSVDDINPTEPFTPKPSDLRVHIGGAGFRSSTVWYDKSDDLGIFGALMVQSGLHRSIVGPLWEFAFPTTRRFCKRAKHRSQHGLIKEHALNK